MDGSKRKAALTEEAWMDRKEGAVGVADKQSEVRVSILMQRTRHNMGISYKTITINHHTVASIEIAVEGTTAKWKCSLIDNQ